MKQSSQRETGRRPITVGTLFSQTGATAVMEASMLQATLFAIEEVNQAGGIGGRELVPIVCDPGSELTNYARLATKLLTEDGVRVIFGCYMSSTRKAVLPVVERLNGLLCYPAQYEGFECSPNVIYTGSAPNQNSLQLGQYLLQHVGKRFFMVGADYIWPWEADRVMSEMLREGGGETVGERYLKLDAPLGDYGKLIREIVAASPDGIFCNFVGEGIVNFYRAYADAGLNPRTMPIASLTTSEADVQAIGAAAAVGHITAAPYFQTVQTEANRRCVAKARKRFGSDVVTNMCWESAYFQLHMAAAAMRQTGSDRTQLLRAAMLGQEFDAPQGRVRIDPDNNHTYLWPRIARANVDGQFDIIAESSSAVKPDPYLVSHNLFDWGTVAME